MKLNGVWDIRWLYFHWVKQCPGNKLCVIQVFQINVLNVTSLIDLNGKMCDPIL